jgi:NADH-quinone oxidoreductase subunit A
MDIPLIPIASDPVATLVFFLIVFAVVGAFFLFIHLVMGSAIRPNRPDTEKLTIYECGEPTVGSAWVQFDVRYYVVALLFVIFDVEVAFFFPWATVFGKANQLSALEAPLAQAEENKKELSKNLNPKNLPLKDLADADRAKLEDAERQLAEVQQQQERLSSELLPSGLTPKAKQQMGLTKTAKNAAKEEIIPIQPEVARKWAQVAFVDILVFFGVLLVGFAYVWRRGDINWVRAYAHHKEPPVEAAAPLEQPNPPAAPAPVAVH